MSPPREKELIPSWAQRMIGFGGTIAVAAIGYGELRGEVKATASGLSEVKVAQAAAVAQSAVAEAAIVAKVDAIGSKADKSDGKLDVIITLLLPKTQTAQVP